MVVHLKSMYLWMQCLLDAQCCSILTVLFFLIFICLFHQLLLKIFVSIYTCVEVLLSCMYKCRIFISFWWIITKWSSYLVILLAKFTLSDIGISLDLRALELHLFNSRYFKTHKILVSSWYPLTAFHFFSVSLSFHLSFRKGLLIYLTVSIFHLHFWRFFSPDLDFKAGSYFLSASWR